MSTNEENQSQTWKRPDELIKLHRLKQKKKQLAARFNHNSNNERQLPGGAISETDKSQLLEAKIAQKRKNPFAKTGTDDNTKKSKTVTESSSFQPVEEESLLDFVNTPPASSRTEEIFVKDTPQRAAPAKLVLKPFDPKAFAKLLHPSAAAADDEDDAALEQQKFSEHLPMDWSLKTRVRLFCPSELPTTTLKTSQMASGLTSCVRCIDMQQESGSLDISPATRFNQATYYWQHPHLPWMTLFPRSSKENAGITVGERERKALAEDWDCSFRGLFQLLRARQCPYFYLCANTFTVLFRAAGTAGSVVAHALMTPTTRGMRSALRQEGIEYSMPLKKGAGLNKSADGSFSDESNSVAVLEAAKSEVLSNSHDASSNADKNAKEDDDDEDEDEDWLANLGVDEKEIRKIESAHARKLKVKEMSEDFSDNSLLLIEGDECQGFFSFLLNAKSTISNVGRLAGVPPTLLAPVAFPKATMQHLTTRSSKVRSEGVDYCSIEVKGVVMPTFMPYICQLLGETKDTFSATLVSSNNTLAFSKATQKLLEAPKPEATAEDDDEEEPEVHEDSTAGQVFGRENLSDCGLLPDVIEGICRRGLNAVSLLERVCYNKVGGYAWS